MIVFEKGFNFRIFQSAMKNLVYIFLFFSLSIVAQKSIEATFIKKIPFNEQTLIGIDNFGTLFYISNSTFYKNDKEKIITYSNIQLGPITSANAFNPLKINLFYRDFNTAVILDNRLAEIFKIDFNRIQPYKNVTYISMGNDNTLWIFNQDTQQLEVFDYKTKSTRATTLPIQSEILDITSNYNYCWLLTKDAVFLYNYFGSLILKIKNEGYTAIVESNDNLILQKENELYFLEKNSDKIQKIKTPKLLISQFFVTNETVYIYDDEYLQYYQLKTN